MSRTRHHRNQRSGKLGVDMFRPGPLSWASKTTANLKFERRMMRHIATNRIKRMVCAAAERKWSEE